MSRRPRASGRGPRVGAAVLLAAAACGHAPPKPAPSVKAEIAAADEAERHRQHDVARSHYERALAAAKDPASEAFARHEYAEALISWGELPAAKAQLERAVTAKPDDAGAWHDLGMIRHHDGDDAGAKLAFARSKQLAPADPRPRITLAAFLWQTGDRAGAAAEYRALLDLDIPDRLREKVHWALEQLEHTP